MTYIVVAELVGTSTLKFTERLWIPHYIAL